MLTKVKQSLRITHNALDIEVQDLIDAAMMDLSISGVKVINITDPLIVRAVTLYCKSHFGLANEDSEKYMHGYTTLKSHLALCGDYNVNV